ncbi:MAG: hypothetical protein HYZ37_17295 [Candidatus Solibacter usitatus]|nr:hypothetical protein [Candidatus Solibacter usitatus]
MKGLTRTLIFCAGVSLAGDWTNWRGPRINGTADGDAPLTFSDTTNIAWKINIPGRGHSTPVILGNKIFLTTAVPAQPDDPSLAAPRRGPGGPGGVSQDIKARKYIIGG